MKRATVEILGWVGMVEILTAYTLNAVGVISAGLIYLVLNASGALFLSFISFQKHAWQPFCLNVTWTLIGLIALIRLSI